MQNNFFRLHHVRPRFKNDIENVLVFMATEISKIDEKELKAFNKELFDAIRLYPENAVKAVKTINNWRTEIAAIFGLILEDIDKGTAKPGTIAKKLAEEQDLVRFFKYFLFHFQFPGGHIKSNKLKVIIDNNIKFKPAQYFLKVFKAGEELTGKRFSLNKAEAAYFIYNDLRVIRDNCSPDEVVKRILAARNQKIKLDWRGDVIRYAGDILDYMLIADLLVLHGSYDYYLNTRDIETVLSFINSNLWFDGYDNFYAGEYSLSDLNAVEPYWFNFVNSSIDESLFKTDLIKYLGIEQDDYTQLLIKTINAFEESFNIDDEKSAKEIGDFGENLVIGHECMRVKLGNRFDLIHLIKKIPSHFAVGYDIQSVNLDSTKRYIEVKSTISNRNINFFNFHLTPNEWLTAETLQECYFVYRLMISKENTKLFILNNPVGKYKNDLIKMTPRNGVDVIFNEKSGVWTELLIWKP